MNAPVDTRLFSSIEPLRLAGSECSACRTTTFPVQVDCPNCARRSMVEVTLPTEGVLWTWTMQSFEPKPPYVAPASGFQPFPVGYVDLGPLIVETRLDAEPADLRTGQPMKLVPMDVLTPSHDAVLGYAFAPIPEGTQ